MKTVLQSLFLTMLISVQLPVLATEIRLAVAANFRPTLEALVNDYQSKYGGKFSISSASTSVLYAQIKQGAPFDLFFSADEQTPVRLTKELNIDQSPFSYAEGLLVFWCPKGSPKNLAELQNWRGSYGMANPKLAPYGMATQAIIHKLGWPAEQQAIMGNNVSQVAQFIQTHNVQCGFLAKSLVPKDTDSMQLLNLPTTWYPKIVQQAMLLPHVNRNVNALALAKDFLHFVRTEARSHIEQTGYDLPRVSAD
jgi:molybdate transport system substrate-binding protein